MFSYSSLGVLAALALTFSSVSSLRVLQPRPTDPAIDSHPHIISGWTPKPTPAPGSRLGPHAGLKRAEDLFKRSLSYSATCGYIDKNYNDAVVCPNGRGCGFWPAIPVFESQYGLNQGALECCPVVGTANSYDFADCTPPTTCMDYTSASNPSGDQTTVDGTVMCGSDLSKCATFSFIGAPKSIWQTAESSSLAVATYTNLYCADSSTVDLVYMDATNAPKSSTSTASSSAAPLSKHAGGVNGGGRVGGGGGGGRKGGDDQPDVKSGSGGGTNVGAIAGGTVGGVLFVAAVAAGLGYLIWRKRQQRVAPVREISTYEPTNSSAPMSQYGGSQYAPSQGGYGPVSQELPVQHYPYPHGN